MSKYSIHNKTIRPGSLGGYSQYYSSRSKAGVPPQPSSKRRPAAWKVIVPVLVVAALIAVPLLRGSDKDMQITTKSPTSAKAPQPSQKTAPAVAATPAPVNNCAANTETKLIKVSVSQRHLWACEGSATAYDSPVITGIEAHAETLTPRGTYHIYAKVADTVLTGSDSTGSWRDPVSYWMPFLDNQYGTYGFHDATWRADNAFGNIDPNSSDASHGCVELPIASSKWIYDWAPTRTLVTVET